MPLLPPPSRTPTAPATAGRSRVQGGLAAVAVALAAFAAMTAFAGFELDRAGAAEAGYLALVAAVVLLATGFLAPRPALEPGLGAVLAVTAVWALPPGPGRGAAVLAALVAAFGIAAWRRLGRTGPELPLGVAVPLALGAQALLRGEILFHPEPRLRAVFALVALPVAAAAATAILSRRHGERALLAAAAAALLAPGWNVAATLALIALAAGDMASPRQAPQVAARHASPLRRHGGGTPARVAAGLALLAPVAWEPRAGLLAAAAGLVLWRPREGAGAAVLLAAALALFAPVRPPGAALAAAALLLLLVPVLPLAGRAGLWRPLAAAALAIAAGFGVPGPAALAAPVALAALALPEGEAAAAFQRAWSAALLAGAALLASYPWLRQSPLAASLEVLGLAATPGAALAFCALASLLALGLSRLFRGSPERSRGRAEPLVAGVLLLTLLLRLPAPGKALLPGGEVTLTADRPLWEAGLAGAPAAELVVDSNLANGAELAPGTPVATARLREASGRSREWTLRAGRETGEWAARRPDLLALGIATPEPWVSWIAGDFLGQRYRARWRPGGAPRVVRLTIERRADLPPQVGLAIYQVEVCR